MQRKVRLKKQIDKDVKLLKAKILSLKKKILNLKTCNSREDKLVINKDIANIIENRTDNISVSQKYSYSREECKLFTLIRSLALTLNFYSFKAYPYVQSFFSNCTRNTHNTEFSIKLENCMAMLNVVRELGVHNDKLPIGKEETLLMSFP